MLPLTHNNSEPEYHCWLSLTKWLGILDDKMALFEALWSTWIQHNLPSNFDHASWTVELICNFFQIALGDLKWLPDNKAPSLPYPSPFPTSTPSPKFFTSLPTDESFLIVSYCLTQPLNIALYSWRNHNLDHVALQIWVLCLPLLKCQ